MTTEELPNCLKLIYHYFEQIVTENNQLPYMGFRYQLLNAIVWATDGYHKDICPVHSSYTGNNLQVMFFIYEKGTIVLIVNFLRPYTEEFLRASPPEEVTVQELKELIKQLDDFYAYT